MSLKRARVSLERGVNNYEYICYSVKPILELEPVLNKGLV